MTTLKPKYREYLQFAEYISASKGLLYEWPDAVMEAAEHLKELAFEMIEQEGI